MNQIEVMQQALDVLTEVWYSNTTSIANQKFTLVTEALRTAIEQNKHQEFIDSFNLTDNLDDKMFMQIEHWARQSYRRHRTSVRGQMISRDDCYDSHVVWATLKWVKENTPAAPQPQPTDTTSQLRPIQEPLYTASKTQTRALEEDSVCETTEYYQDQIIHWRNNADCLQQQVDDDTALLQQSLEVLECSYFLDIDKGIQAIAALKERLK